MQDSTGLVLNWYGPSTFDTQVNSIPVSIQQATAYPRDGRVVVSVIPQKEVAFALKLRIPHWSATTTAALNGQPLKVSPGEYLTIDRRWKSGDKITLDFDMTLRAWAGERECAGKAALYRGPILLAYEPAPGEESEKSKDASISAARFASSKSPPTFDAQRLREPEIVYGEPAGSLTVRVKNIDGEVVELHDFGRAGANGANYFTWLPMSNSTLVEFTRDNPSRTFHLNAKGKPH